MDDGGGARVSFAFEGKLGDFARIAFVNLLVTLLTLGVYAFWGSARARRYLWSHTRFIDDHLEWTGTGKELFKGFVAVLLLVLLPLFALNLLLQSVSRAIAAGAFSTTNSTARRSLSPAPATIVSSIWLSKVSPRSRTAAMPPCAQAVEPADSAPFDSTTTRARSARLSAAVSPAAPDPTMTTSKFCAAGAGARLAMTGM